MTSFGVWGNWANIKPDGGGEAKSTGMPPDHESIQSRVTNLSLYKH
jgi:hypothetical protein